MSKHIIDLPLNKEKLDNYTLNAFKKIQKAKTECLKMEEQEDFQNWIRYRDNMYKTYILIDNLKELLKNNNHKIVDDKGFKNMIASIVYRHSQ
tara:strand:- start:194 stop:472 length:279 start_codon:yes stop_codon:yes gene_type:complete